MYTFSIVGPIVNVYTSINRVRFEELCFDLFKGINIGGQPGGTRVVRPTYQNMYHQKQSKRPFFKIMLQRGVNNTPF